MEHNCWIGESAMRDFTLWWEEHLPAWLLVYALEGSAELTLQFHTYSFRQGMAAIIAPDMFPDFGTLSPDFKAFYCLMDRPFAEQAFSNIPNRFFEAIYLQPILPIDQQMKTWMALLQQTYTNERNSYRPNILTDLLHAFALDYLHRWEQTYGEQNISEPRKSAEALCMRFYQWVFDHSREQRSTAFYADQLCITPCYLAMITRQVCQETPKQAIDRQVILEIKYLLRNTQMTAEQIATELHSTDTSYLCRFFRKRTGLTLSAYRHAL